jgi:hypothetical protein
VTGLWDGRKMPLESKVNHSETNSIKRLSNDAAVESQHLSLLTVCKGNERERPSVHSQAEPT